jgi:chaperonin GroES
VLIKNENNSKEANRMKLVPLGERVVLKQVEAEEKTKSGIILSNEAKEKPSYAEVVAVGPGTDKVQMEVKAGQKVVYSKYAGLETKVDGEEFIIIKQSDILAVLED